MATMTVVLTTLVAPFEGSVTDVVLRSQAVTGPTGPQGATGATGATGPTGPQGPSGVIAVTSPVTNSGTSTSASLGLDQTALSITASQVSDGTTVFARLGAANTFSVGGHQINNANAAVKPLVVKGAAAQSANLQEWQDSSSVVRANVTAIGQIETTSGVRFYTSTARTGWSSLTNTSGNLSFNYPFALTDRLTVTAGAAATVPATVKGAAAQTANLQDWQNSGGSAVAAVSSGGAITALSFLTSSARGIVAEASSGGYLRLTRMTASLTNPGANIAGIYFRDGTTAGTLKLVVRAGAAGAETTILDNIPQ